MPPDVLCPENTTIKDFAYPESHPLHLSNFPTSQRSSISSSDSSGYEDFGGEEYSDDDTLGPEEINRKAVALFDFEPENDNEVPLTEGQIIWISYRHGQGWLVAEDPESGENGLVPEGYVEICFSEGDEEEEEVGRESRTQPQQDVPKPFIPRLLQEYKNPEEDSEWEDTDLEDTSHDNHDASADQFKDTESLDIQMKAAKIQ
ncbi:HOG (high osmolarity glycerol) pathway protein [Candidozyma auris]|uniref:SH3 domain-containing protein n=2 Tax=Candidozyma auris TaxID=498019 RepID=A0A2H0ZWH9_CANAR|nr:hypothetical protein QG37_00407 [[Candida] auris]PIS54989.1 hypothetical protein B9J08_002139 [[Candida] auris]QWW24265.1 hypothetical protein CA7LBN_003099 [[Candida] auris]